MDVHLHHALGSVKIHLTDVASRAEKRRLRMHGDIIRCRARCSGCCARLINVSMAEAVIAYEHLKQDGTWPDVRKKAIEQMGILRITDPMAWFKMNRKCPILNTDTNLCRAYAVRPATCSTHFVSSDPELCDPWSTHAGKFETVNFPDLFQKFQGRMAECVQGYGIFTLVLPIPSGLLLAERISVKSNLDFSEVITFFFHEL